MPWDRDSLIAAVAAEGRDVDLSEAVRRSGWESVVLETRDGWILRFPRPHVAFEREVALLRRIAGRLPARTPAIEWTGERTKFAAYRKLKGCGFDVNAYHRAPSPQRDRLARSLAGFLVAMHGVLTPGEIAELGIPGAGGDSDDARIPDRLDRVPGAVRHDVETLLVEIATLRSRADLGPPVLLHDDFHFGNVVLDGPVGELVGVWDFSGRPAGSSRPRVRAAQRPTRRHSRRHRDAPTRGRLRRAGSRRAGDTCGCRCELAGGRRALTVRTRRRRHWQDRPT